MTVSISPTHIFAGLAVGAQEDRACPTERKIARAVRGEAKRLPKAHAAVLSRQVGLWGRDSGSSGGVPLR